jgi:hypothetical protein
LEAARAEIGTKESPAGSNNVKYNTEFYGRAVSGSQYNWCAVFVAWCFGKAGMLELTPFYKSGEKFRYNALNAAYCPNWETVAKQLEQWVSPSDNPGKNYKAGDVVLFRFTATGMASHIGIVEQVNSDGTLTTIEGNTGNGEVRRQTRYQDKTLLGAFRPEYAAAGYPQGVETPPVGSAELPPPPPSERGASLGEGGLPPAASGGIPPQGGGQGEGTDDWTLLERARSAINKLVTLGRIDSPWVWREAVEGKTSPSPGQIAALLIKWREDAEDGK